MSLKDLIRQVHGPEALLPKLDVWLLKKEQLPSNRSGGWHPSSFHSMCPRESVISKLLQIDDTWHIDQRLRRIFDNGHALHDWYQNKYFGPMGLLWGRWMCSRCEEVTVGFMPKEKCLCQRITGCVHYCEDTEADLAFPRLDPKKQEARGGCNHCGIWGSWQFDEIPVSLRMEVGIETFDVETKKALKHAIVINGASDGVLVIDGRWIVLEIKTINDRGFNALPGPQDGHMRQAMLYTRLLQDDVREAAGFFAKLPVQPEGLLVLYINKNDANLKEFYVPFDKPLADRLLEAPAEFERAMFKKEMPNRIPECKSMFTKRAKDCPQTSYCFGGKSWDELVQIGKKT